MTTTYQNRQKQQPLWLDKPLPSNVDVERATLGAILIDNALIAEAAETLTEEHFYIPSYRHIFNAMLRLFEKSAIITSITLSEELKRSEAPEHTSKISQLENLTTGLPHTSTLETQIKILSNRARERALIKTCSKIIAEVGSGVEDTDSLIDKAEGEIFRLAEVTQRAGVEDMSLLVERELELAQDVKTHNGITGVTTGLKDVDYYTSGLQPSDLIVIAARPSQGKSALAFTVASNAATVNQNVVAVFSLEMNKRQCAQRMIAQEAKVDLHRLRSGAIYPQEWTFLAKAQESFATRKILIDDTASLSVMQLRAKARRIRAEHKRLDLIIVDYLQLMTGTGRIESRQQEVSQISRDLKAMAKEFEVPLIALAQLSRAPETRADHRPILSDLRESGAIEMDADVVAFIYREETYHPTPENLGLAEIIIAKQRQGPTGTAKTAFLKEFSRFENLYSE